MAVDQSETWFANIKTLFDNFLQESLTDIREKRTFFSKLVSDAQQHDNTRQTVANQALQNAVETANMVSKQAIRHSDIAVDQEWNPVQQAAGDVLTARSVTIDDASLKAIGAIIASALADALAKKAA
jgi:hypothetical protein